MDQTFTAKIVELIDIIGKKIEEKMGANGILILGVVVLVFAIAGKTGYLTGPWWIDSWNFMIAGSIITRSAFMHFEN